VRAHTPILKRVRYGSTSRIAVIARPLYPGMALATQFDPTLLAPAIEAARRSLRRLDEEHVPPKLRNLASRSGKLPIPLARRLLAELNSSDWLRAEAAEELDPDVDRASFLFLLRPKGWQEELSEISAHGTNSVQVANTRKLESDLRRALEKMTRLEASVARSREREAKAASSAKEKVEAEVVKRERALTAQQVTLDQLRKEKAELESRAAALAEEKADLIGRLEILRSVQRRKTEPSPAREPVFGWAPREPVELARHLDDVIAAARVPVKAVGPGEGFSARSHLNLPPAIRPDHAESIQWLLDIPEDAMVAIDGWNAAHQLKSPPGSGERDRVVEAARRIAIASIGRRAVLVIFDSSQGVESFTTKEFEVRYVPSADEELITLAAGRPAGLIVITSDRRVREAVESAGAIGLWSEALIDWLNTAGRRTFGA
jgi:hypothetical protein